MIQSANSQPPQMQQTSWMGAPVSPRRVCYHVHPTLPDVLNSQGENLPTLSSTLEPKTTQTRGLHTRLGTRRERLKSLPHSAGAPRLPTTGPARGDMGWQTLGMTHLWPPSAVWLPQKEGGGLRLSQAEPNASAGWGFDPKPAGCSEPLARCTAQPCDPKAPLGAILSSPELPHLFTSTWQHTSEFLVGFYKILPRSSFTTASSRNKIYLPSLLLSVTKCLSL